VKGAPILSWLLVGCVDCTQNSSCMVFTPQLLVILLHQDVIPSLFNPEKWQEIHCPMCSVGQMRLGSVVWAHL